MVRTSIHAGVWSTDPDPEKVARVLAEVAATGFECLALPLRNLPTLRPDALSAQFRRAGIIPLGTTGLPAGADVSSDDAERRNKGEQHLRRVVAVARDIGVEQVNGVLYGPLGHAGQPVDADARRRSAEVVSRTADAAAQAGVRLCVELVNRYETAMLNSVEQGREYLALVDHPNVRLHVDTYHMAIEERDPVGAVRAALPVLGYFELDQSHRGRLDEGSLDLRAFAEPVRTSGYDGLVGVEAFSRSGLAPDHANVLSIWRDQFKDGTALAHQAMGLIREIFGGAESASRSVATR
ncbi:MAG: sugar phosphate isomerase/epimerase [Mesorhizobium sp.]|nr:sugar phosphate isomerase/epimerase family protein [Mesorhizobium sp.]MBL8578302.1 sugar phosphate isomerase/epimerase [Mesorhizobium sp.]